MEGKFFQLPSVETERPRSISERALEGALTAGGFKDATVRDGVLSWSGKNGKTVRAERVTNFGPAVDLVLGRLDASPDNARLSHAVVMMALGQNQSTVLEGDLRLRQYANSIPGAVRTQANELVQKAHAEVRRNERIAKAEERRAKEYAANLARTEAAREQSRREAESRRAAEAFAAAEEAVKSNQKPKESFDALNEDEQRLRLSYESLARELAPELTIESFSAVGSAERRFVDLRLQQELAVRYAQQRDERPELAFGDLLEAFMRTELARQDWFGAAYVQTSKFDDYCNGTDGVLEWPGEGTEPPIRLALDYTVSASSDLLKEKLMKVKRGVEVRYFRSSVRDAHGDAQEETLQGVPMVILGVDRAMLRKTLLETGGKPEALREHPIRALLIEQAAVQVGLQVREMSARLVGNVIGREASVSDRLREAVLWYASEARAGSMAKKTPEVAGAFSGISDLELGRGFQSPEQGHRLFQLLRVYRELHDRRERLKRSGSYRAAKGWAGDSKTHRRLSKEDPVSRLVGFVRGRFGRAQFFGEFAFGALRRVLEGFDGVKDVVRGSFEPGRYGAFWFWHSHGILTNEV